MTQSELNSTQVRRLNQPSLQSRSKVEPNQVWFGTWVERRLDRALKFLLGRKHVMLFFRVEHAVFKFLRHCVDLVHFVCLTWKLVFFTLSRFFSTFMSVVPLFYSFFLITMKLFSRYLCITKSNMRYNFHCLITQFFLVFQQFHSSCHVRQRFQVVFSQEQKDWLLHLRKVGYFEY